MYKLERLLCPTDFSTASLDVIRYALFLVQPHGGSITLMHVDEFEKSPLGCLAFNNQKRAEHREATKAFASDQFSKIIDNLKLDSQRTSALVRFGTAYEEIINEAETNEYSAVIFSTRGIGCTSPHLIGRTAERIVRLCRTPAFSIRPRQTDTIWKIGLILCPTDFSEYGNYALPYAISLARYCKAKLILLHVTDLSVSEPERLVAKFPDLQMYHDHASEIAIERLVGRDVEPENTIIRISEEYQVDLIVMGTYGARGMRTVQIGNTTEEVIRKVNVPVLSVNHPIHKIVFPHRFTHEYQETKND